MAAMRMVAVAAAVGLLVASCVFLELSSTMMSRFLCGGDGGGGGGSHDGFSSCLGGTTRTSNKTIVLPQHGTSTTGRRSSGGPSSSSFQTKTAIRTNTTTRTTTVSTTTQTKRKRRGNGTTATLPSNPTSSRGGCCYIFDLTDLANMAERFTPEFFFRKEEEKDPKSPLSSWWKGNEYEGWRNFSQSLRLNHQEEETKGAGASSSSSSSSLSCEQQWTLTVLNTSDDRYLSTNIQSLIRTQNKESYFPYIRDVMANEKHQAAAAAAPRILQLGDSISRSTWLKTHELFSKRKVAKLKGAPTQCGGFHKYDDHLDEWLGDCAWDLVQFNVGMHYHPPSNGHGEDNNQQQHQKHWWRREYANGIRRIVSKIRSHSPTAHIVFASTTPSPLDSNATWPDEHTCVNFHKFHKSGFIQSMNQVALRLGTRLNYTFNDRYAAILPKLDQDIMNECDIHYNPTGYDILAKSDWRVFSELLGLRTSTLERRRRQR